MLNQLPNPAPRRPGERGIVLMLALIVLVAMSLAAVAMMRGVLTGNRVAANLAFQQSAMQSAETGVETAIAWLEQKARELKTVGSTELANELNADIAASSSNYAYTAHREDPASTQTWQQYWDDVLTPASKVNTLSKDGAGNTVSFVIQRLCNSAGAPTDGIGCEASPTVSTSTATSSKSNTLKLTTPSQVYYRITVRVAGPRGAVSFVQTVVAI